jgi:predicted ribosome quality control (RQC) complex YloA/Tae2 family protein
LTHLTSARLQRFETVSAAMEAFYARIEATRPRRGDTLALERKSLLASLERASRSAERRIAGLRHQLDIARSEREPLRRVGQALLAQQRDIVPGAGEVMVDGQAFELDPRLSAVENAQAYFARYRKAREAEERVPQLLQEAQTIADHLANLRALVELADGVDAIRALRREVGLATGGRPPRSGGSKQGQRSAPYRKIALGPGWEALVGSSAEGNAWVTFDLAGGDDLWLHARGVPGAHVVVRTGGREPPEAVVQRAAQVAAEQSSARGAAAVEVDVARRRYVKKIPGGPPGLVRYTHERTVRVTPRSAQDMASSLLIREPAIIDAALR